MRARHIPFRLVSLPRYLLPSLALPQRIKTLSTVPTFQPLHNFSTQTPVQGGNNEPYVVEVNVTNFEKLVVRSSLPVILYFYSPTHPSTQPVFSVLEERAKNSQRFRFAKINVETSQELIQALRLPNVPCLFSVNKGQKVTDFLGGNADTLNKFIDDTIALAPASPVTLKDLNEKAKALLESGDIPAATSAFNQCFLDKAPLGEALGLAGLIRCSLKGGDLNLAKELADTLRTKNNTELNNDDVRQALTLVDLSAGGADVGAIEDLKRKIQSDPENQEARFELASAYLANGDFETAIEECLGMIKKDKRWNEEAARKLLLKIFEAAGNSSPLTVASRSRLSSIWFI